MADTQPGQFSITLQDDLGTKASQTTYWLIDPAMTVTQLAAAWQAYVALVQAVSGGNLLHGRASIELTPTTPASAVAGSRVEQTGVFDFKNASNSRIFGSPLPALLDTKISAGKINLSDTDITNYYTFLSSTHTLYEPTNNEFLLLNGLVDAFISFRKHRRSLSRSSFEV